MKIMRKRRKRVIGDSGSTKDDHLWQRLTLGLGFWPDIMKNMSKSNTTLSRVVLIFIEIYIDELA